MRINTNISAIIANNQLSKSESNLSKSLERLSSGYKINQAADDTTGMAVSLKIKLQLRGLDQSSDNAADGISVIQTAEGALTEVQSMIERMKELSVQAANDVNSASEREAIQNEINALNGEIDRITGDSDFNTKPLLDGNLARRIYPNVKGVTQLECSTNLSAGTYSIEVLANAKQAKASISTSGLPAEIPADMAGTIKINGYDVEVKEGDKKEDVIYKINSACNQIECKAVDNGGNIDISTNEFGKDIELKIGTTNEKLSAALGVGDGITANGEDLSMKLPDDSGFNSTAKFSTQGNQVKITDVNDIEFRFIVPDGLEGQKVTQEIKDIGMMKIHVGANEGQQIELDIPKINTETLNLQNINVMTFDTASRAITKADEALARVSEIRSRLGAYENRLEHTTSNLDISNENLTAALSRIIDTDMAEEMTEYTSQNVLAQAGTSVLSQANQRPEGVLQLLQG